MLAVSSRKWLKSAAVASILGGMATVGVNGLIAQNTVPRPATAGTAAAPAVQARPATAVPQPTAPGTAAARPAIPAQPTSGVPVGAPQGGVPQPTAAQQAAAAQAAAQPAAAPAPLSVSPSGQPLKNKLTIEQLGNLLAGLGLKAEKTDTRFDFAFAAKHEEEWELSMSAVLSNDGDTIWVMAWLDELPKNSNEIPRVALLRLLADNDKLGTGKFFAYVPSNRRFVLQRVILNENITSAGFRDVLIDLGRAVAGTYSHWSVTSWQEGVGTGSSGEQQAGTNVPAPIGGAATAGPGPAAPTTTNGGVRPATTATAPAAQQVPVARPQPGVAPATVPANNVPRTATGPAPAGQPAQPGAVRR